MFQANSVLRKLALAAPLSLLACSSLAESRSLPAGSLPEGQSDAGSPAASRTPEDAQAPGAGQGADAGVPLGSSDAQGPDAGPPAVWRRVTMSFDELAAGEEVTAQYSPQATFSSSPGCACETSANGGFAASQPNFLMTYYSCAEGSRAPVFIDFGSPVRHPSLKLIAVNGRGRVATLRLVSEDGSVTERDVTGNGDYNVPVLVEDQQASGITRLELVDIDDAFGIGLDDVAFDALDSGESDR